MLKWLSEIFSHKAGSPKLLSRKDHIERLITNYKRRLQILREQQPTSKQNIGQVAPHILMEIEDIEAEIQRLQTMVADESYKNKAEVQAMIIAYQRRLQILKEVEVRSTLQDSDKEVQEIEAEIQRLQTELKQVDS
jgi:hypothetical protein